MQRAGSAPSATRPPHDPPDGRLRVIVIDDETVSRAGLVAIFDDDPWIDLVDSAAHITEGAQIVHREHPDLTVLSVDHFEEADDEAAGRFIATVDSPVLLIARDPSVHLIREAQRLGAAGLISKTAPVPAIRGAVHAAGAGADVFPRLPRRLGSAPPSEREQQIIERVTEGRTNDEIAGALGLSTRTIASHLRRCFIRYEVSSRTELAMLALRERWCTERPAAVSGGGAA